jgi:DNA-directed RNA polymerase subunit M/transcription elongation factor TFIIS
VVVLVLPLFLFPNALLAQSPAEFVGLQSQLLAQQVRREVAEFERSCYASAAPLANGALPPELARAITVELERQAAVVRTGAPGAADSATGKDWAAAKARYEGMLNRRIAFQGEVELREPLEGFDWDTKAEAPFRFGIADAVLLGACLAVGVVSLRKAARESRLANRRARRARGVAASFLVAMSLVSASGCEQPQKPALSWLQYRILQLEPEVKSATARAEEAVAAADAERGKFIERRAAMLPGTKAEQELEVLAKARETLFQAKVAERMAQAAEEERTALEADLTALAALRSSNRWHSLGFLGLRILAATLLGVLALSPLIRSRRKRVKEREAAAETCPRCLAQGKLVEQPSALKDDRYTEARIVECRACEYRFRETSPGEARLCFPTVGVRSSGKTHMLATAYAAAKKGQTRTTARMVPAPSLGDERFNVYIELVLKQRGTAGATVHGQRAEDMPYPILFSATDTDRLGSNSVMVNLFDYSGEMMGESLDVGLLRRRAVLMDGFLLFLDPTQMYGDTQDGEATLSIEDQLKALSDFAHDLEAGRKLKPGTRLDVPVAVCISKFDRVATHSPMGGQALPFLDHLRTALNPPGPANLELLKARSETVEQMLPFMLPGIDLGKILREHFGGRFLFFPTSDRGFAASAPGWKSESAYRPTPVPFGVVEPILWLLHMHGYEMLDPLGTATTPPAKTPRRPKSGGTGK